jgi:type IV pilus assembly protein PilX
MINIQKKSKVNVIIQTKKQQGLVLFVALIALVAMSLAAAALIRSVDSSVLLAGNLAFKQSATMSADTALSLASNYLTANALTLNTDDKTRGYHASVGIDLKADSTWTNANSVLAAAGSGIDSTGKDSSGNEIRYIVQRMCRSTGTAANVQGDCLVGVAAIGGNSNSGPKGVGEKGLTNNGSSTMYRITTRVAGPHNTVSRMQAYIY